MPLTIVRNDIMKMSADAIVNAANTTLKAGGGVCDAIFQAAGSNELQAACDKLAPIQTGEAVITPGFQAAPACAKISDNWGSRIAADFKRRKKKM